MFSLEQRSYFLIFFCIVSNNAEFYFCNNGPHRVKNSECSSGIVFMKIIESKCLGLTMEDATSATATFNASICDENKDAPEFMTAESTNASMKTDVAFQVVELDYTTDVDPDPATPPIDKSSALGECLTQCLPEWIDPSIPLEDEPAYDFGITPPSPDTITEQQNITQGLLTYLMDTLDPDHAPDSKVDMRILDVFQEALNVLEKHCAPYLKPEFMKTLYAAHRFLVLHPSAGDLNDLGVWEHALILSRLKKCKDNPSKFVIESEACGDPSEARIKLINNVRPRLEGKSFRWGLFDFLVEAAWGAAEFAHGYCYKEFMTDLNLQHLLIKSIDALFSKKVQERWMYPTKEQNDMLWSGILGVNDIELIMRNMDACIVAGRKFSPYKDRLGRPFEKQPGTYTPSVVAQAQRQVNETEKGFKGTLDEYWDQYDANGGAKMAISVSGFCTDFQDQFNDGIRAASGHCGPQNSEDDEEDEDDSEEENDIDDY